MATLEDYRAVAPDVLSGTTWTAAQIEAKLDSVPSIAAPKPAPAPTAAQKLALFNLLFAHPTTARAYELEGGAGAIAKAIGITKSQVRNLVDQMARMLDLRRAEG